MEHPITHTMEVSNCTTDLTGVVCRIVRNGSNVALTYTATKLLSDKGDVKVYEMVKAEE